MTRRWRTLRYGPSVALALVGVACGALIRGTLGGTLATGLIGIGLVCVLSFVFYEVGLSEDRDRDRRRSRDEPPRSPAPPPSERSRSASDRAAQPRALKRQRGERRRLR